MISSPLRRKFPIKALLLTLPFSVEKAFVPDLNFREGRDRS